MYGYFVYIFLNLWNFRSFSSIFILWIDIQNNQLNTLDWENHDQKS